MIQAQVIVIINVMPEFNYYNPGGKPSQPTTLVGSQANLVFILQVCGQVLACFLWNSVRTMSVFPPM